MWLGGTDGIVRGRWIAIVIRGTRARARTTSPRVCWSACGRSLIVDVVAVVVLIVVDVNDASCWRMDVYALLLT